MDRAIGDATWRGAQGGQQRTSKLTRQRKQRSIIAKGACSKQSAKDADGDLEERDVATVHDLTRKVVEQPLP